MQEFHAHGALRDPPMKGKASVRFESRYAHSVRDYTPARNPSQTTVPERGAGARGERRTDQRRKAERERGAAPRREAPRRD